MTLPKLESGRLALTSVEARGERVPAAELHVRVPKLDLE